VQKLQSKEAAQWVRKGLRELKFSIEKKIARGGGEGTSNFKHGAVPKDGCGAHLQKMAIGKGGTQVNGKRDELG